MRIAVIGVGNIIFKDDGVGIYASSYIEKNYKFNKDISIVDGGTLGFKLMDYMHEYDKIIILDTISLDDTVGSVYRLPSEELLKSNPYKQTAHEVEVLQILESCQLLENSADVEIVAIVPKDIINVEIALSDDIKSNFELFVKTILDVLKSYEVISSKKAKRISLDDVINSYSNPKND